MVAESYNIVPSTIHLPEISPKPLPHDCTIIFVVGAPGAGKGTQCELLAKQCNYHHLSAGELLRAEQDNPDSVTGELIRERLKQGAIVPMQITISLLKEAIIKRLKTATTGAILLIDGFPRAIDQGMEFERMVRPAKAIISLECSEETSLRRILQRGQDSGRNDDNEESIRKRFKTYKATSLPVVQHFMEEGRRVHRIDANASIEQVHRELSAVIREIVDA
jgi:UMP-CMP kinase